MSRTFAYCRVSTSEQETANQIQEIERRGYVIEAHRVIEESISGSMPALKRPKFAALVEHRLEPDDALIVLKIDRLGRDSVDVLSTVDLLQSRGVKVISLDLSTVDLTSAEGRLILSIMTAYAEFERNRIIERTMEGLRRAKAQGKELGRRKGSKHTDDIQQCKTNGMSQPKTAVYLRIGIATVKRHWNIIAAEDSGNDR
ncbi:DNA-invertase [Pectobacterium brasiliense]|uniref:recombinase family protein n=1 Tax=Pectobacterium brasiliense TaxID=180957 RepID=UPI000CE68936|nr:recombinase family protein [Pectobacterium brasiliense]PPE62233.1 DNA-invertase [Pectobacterium brasiliense]